MAGPHCRAKAAVLLSTRLQEESSVRLATSTKLKSARAKPKSVQEYDHRVLGIGENKIHRESVFDVQDSQAGLCGVEAGPIVSLRIA